MNQDVKNILIEVNNLMGSLDFPNKYRNNMLKIGDKLYKVRGIPTGKKLFASVVACEFYIDEEEITKITYETKSGLKFCVFNNMKKSFFVAEKEKQEDKEEIYFISESKALENAEKIIQERQKIIEQEYKDNMKNICDLKQKIQGVNK